MAHNSDNYFISWIAGKQKVSVQLFMAHNSDKLRNMTEKSLMKSQCIFMAHNSDNSSGNTDDALIVSVQLFMAHNSDIPGVIVESCIQVSVQLFMAHNSDKNMNNPIIGIMCLSATFHGT